ncbi:MAG TPA: DUF2911 domain-containing protein [Bryobacteraceae bacterium]|nr:DUF2911 domain-containing protein [Bryobacteraceae bacterium]
MSPVLILLMIGAAATASAQESPPAQATITVAGKKLSIRYSAPSVRGREIFGDSGLLSHDPTYPAWRAGANDATAFHTDANLDIGGVAVPKGDYTLYCWVKNPDAWELIISKETGQWGLSYNPKLDLGRVKMTMSKPPSPIETMKYTFTDQGGGKVQLQLAWEQHIGAVPIAVK